MNNVEFHAKNCEEGTCFNCGSSSLTRALQSQTFQYGNGESAVQLQVDVPVYSCQECGFEFAGAEAEDIRHEAVCRHLGVLTPTEISMVRESGGLSRIQFAECTGVGIASLKRWETGCLIQNTANDELIYLMIFPENVHRLRARNHFASLEIKDLSCGLGQTRELTFARTFRPRCIKADGHLLNTAEAWTLRA